MNKALRRIFGPAMDGVTGRWRNLHNGEFHSFSTDKKDKMRSDEIGKACSTRRR